MLTALKDDPSLEQGTSEWLELRKTKITATDASSIMGVSPWKTKQQLYYEKLSNDPPSPPNAYMQRGIDLEDLARELFIVKTGIHVFPKVVIKDWAMASLDGMSSCGKHIVEIKCPGSKVHKTSVSGNIPYYYYPQLQHQMYVCSVQMAYYFSFDGIDGVLVKVRRDDEYIEKMVDEELKFYYCLMNKVPPERQGE